MDERTPAGQLPFHSRLMNDLRGIYEQFTYELCDSKTAARLKADYMSYFHNKIQQREFLNIPFRIEIKPISENHSMLISIRDCNDEAFPSLDVFDADPTEILFLMKQDAW
jgi:hypothetical protein